MADIIACLRAALRQNILSQDEFDTFAKRADALRQQMAAPEVKEALAKEIEAEAAHRKEVALMVESARVRLVDTVKGYRDRNGQADPAEAVLLLHHNLLRLGGTHIQSAEELAEVTTKRYISRLTGLMQELRRGSITGDLKRSYGATKVRLEHFVAEVMGEESGDPIAKAMAKAWSEVAEEIRQDFNSRGGAIGKLEGGYIPQGHNAEALMRATFTTADGQKLTGERAWIAYLMADGVLDRERMVHPLTRRRLSDDELRDALSVAWRRITTDGAYDREVTGQGVGRGAVWTQHADHRFIHFKDAKSWLAYAKEYGSSTDVVHALMGHIRIMSRDIAHMTVFGPNPNVMRTYLRQWVEAQAAQVKPFDVLIKDQTAQLKDLAGRLSSPNPDYTRIADRIGEIHTELAAIRRKHTPQLGGKPSARNKAKLEALDDELGRLEQEIAPYYAGDKPVTLDDAKVKAEMEALMADMRSPVPFAERDNPTDYARVTLAKADDWWKVMRAGQLPVNTKWADRLAATRNLLTAAALDGAFFSAWSDPSNAQDTLKRLGVGMGRANAARLLVMGLKEGILRTNRPEAARAWLGWESMMHGFQQQSRMAGAMDVRGWTGFVADRVLTTTLLSPFTQGMKHVVGSTIYAEFADHAGTAWDKLPEAPRTMLARNGFDAASWDAIRAAPIHDSGMGAGWLEPNAIEATAGRELAERYAMMVHRLMRYAVVEGTVESRSLWGTDPPGTVKGELVRAFAQFKGYPVAFVMLHVNRVAGEILRATSAKGRATAVGYAAMMIVTGTLLAGVSLALRDAARWRDPRKWRDDKLGLDPYFWTEAWMRGVGLGIYTDFLKSTTTRTGKGPAEVFSGPLIGLGADVGRLVGESTLVPAQNLIARAQGKKPPSQSRWGKYAVRVGRDITPSHWAIDAAVQRIVWDWLQKEIDPEAAKAFRDQVIRARRENNQEFAWPPGQSRPNRAPDFSRIPATR